MDKIILASSSERRQLLLKQIGLPFEVIESDVEEDNSIEGTPSNLVKTLASKKANAVASKING